MFSLKPVLIRYPTRPISYYPTSSRYIQSYTDPKCKETIPFGSFLVLQFCACFQRHQRLQASSSSQLAIHEGN
ncbi:hypothetical protein Hanom_Chr07g00590341 [Helianthus anomalus]